MPIEAPGEVAFGPFRLDHRNRRLTKAGTAVPLGGRAIDVLSVLIAAAGDTVSKEVLLDRAWPGLTVDANNVEVQISALRKALGEDWIITVPKQGYRLAQRAVAAVHSPPPALPDKPSLVVLPFQNMSGDPEQDYFVDGLVEDITTSLCCIRSLFVIARNSAFSYKGQAVDVRQVGRELGVRYVMEGSVRRVGDRVRITGQLVEATTGIHVWGDRFDEALAEINRAQRLAPDDLGQYVGPVLANTPQGIGFGGHQLILLGKLAEPVFQEFNLRSRSVFRQLSREWRFFRVSVRSFVRTWPRFMFSIDAHKTPPVAMLARLG